MPAPGANLQHVTHFPFAKYRPGQQEALDAAREAFDGGKRFVVLEAPTGAGKSALAVTLAREAASAYLVTAQKLLQDQYLGDFPDLASMRGRSNYECLVADTHAAEAPCTVGVTLPGCEACPYFTAKDEAIAASRTVLNYPYALAEAQHAGMFEPRELLVLDEAHGIEAALMRFVQVELDDASFRRAGLSATVPQGDHAWTLIEWALDLLPDLQEALAQVEGQAKAVRPTGREAIGLYRQRRWLEGRMAAIQWMIDSVENEEADWVVETDRRGDAGRMVRFRPVDVASFAEPLLFHYGRRVLLMSATVLNVPTFLRTLGVRESQAEHVTVASTFPPERRPVRLHPVADLRRATLERDLPKLVEETARIMADHPEEKGVIHAHSYKIARAIADGLPPHLQKRLRLHDAAAGRDDALRHHRTSVEPTVLLSPSMTEGVNLAGDDARFQVLCKVPWPYLGDAQVKARKEREPEWYAWQAAVRLVQAYGRSVRSEDDHAVTYLLDATFPAFIKRQAHLLPVWFHEAVDPP